VSFGGEKDKIFSVFADEPFMKSGKDVLSFIKSDWKVFYIRYNDRNLAIF
jgi:hypothetical protein